MRRRNGFTLIEIVVAMAILALFIFVSLSLTMELHKRERELRLDFYRHPQIMAVLARMRRDVADANGRRPYRSEYDGYTNGPTTLILETLTPTGGTQMVVWDFSTPRIVVRRSYNVGAVRVWAARGVPAGWEIGAASNPGGGWTGVHLTATDDNGRTAIDQIFFPRAAK